MSEKCAACRPIQSESRWKRFGAWTGLILFCPCHLPLTIAGLLVILSASGLPIADSWGRPLLYAIFGGSFLFFLILVFRMVSRHRARERERAAEHALHETQTVTTKQPAARPMEG